MKDFFVTTKFYINKEKKTVVCTITAINDINRKLVKYGLRDPITDFNDDNTDICVYRGVAKCSPKDQWDEEYGKHLAEYRAQLARQKDVNKKLKNIIQHTFRQLDNLFDYGMMKDPHKPTERTNL